MWLRIDDNLPDHPKFASLDPMATCLWLYGLCYAGRFLTDGRIPQAIALQLAARVTAQQSLLGESELVRRLVTAGLWIVIPTGYRIHDFLHHNPSRRKVLAERKAARLRRQKTRQDRVSANGASPERRPTFQEDSPVNDPTRPDPTRSKELKDRRRDRSALHMAQDAHNVALGEASARLVQAASERFGWTLTKTRQAEEWRLAGELLEHWDEPTILLAIAQRRKLSSMRWLAEFIPQMLAHAEPLPKQRPAVVEHPTLTADQIAVRDRGLAMVAATAAALPKMPG